MRILKPLLFVFMFVLCRPVAAQIESYDEIDVEQDSVRSVYKPTQRNYALLRSKRGTSGLNKTSKGDSIMAFPVTEIVLVYSELTKSAIEEREEANRERWDNLIKTYPEFFQENTTFKSLCQCNTSGDSAAFKKAQGFYVYFTGEEPKAEEKVAEVKPVKTEEKKTEEKKPEEKKAEEKKVADKKTAEPAEEKKPEKPAAGKKEPEESAVTEKATVKTTEPVKEKEQQQAKETTEVAEEKEEPAAPVVTKATPKLKSPVVKARKSKDPKACRPPCYEGGDEDLNAFFKQNITLSKKQRRKSKKLVSVVKVQLNADGSIKKTMVTGENEVFNQQVEQALKAMNNWNSAVKNGTAIKSEVRITLKYDAETKGIKPFEVAPIPRLGPKCKCASDSEIFGN